MGLMDRDYFVEESLKRIGIIERDSKAPARTSPTAHRTTRPSQWGPVIVVALVMVVVAVVVRAWRSGWF